MSDDACLPKSPPDERPAAQTELQRRRAHVVDVLAETLVELLLKQRRERSRGAAR